MEIKFDIPGPPQGKARPRVVRTKSGQSMSFTPDKTVAYEELTRMRYQAAADGYVFPDDCALKIVINVGCPIPKSASEKSRKSMVVGKLRPTKKPDCDNIAKIICDALNGVAYHDDKQIVAINMAKWYIDGPGLVQVTIQEDKT